MNASVSGLFANATRLATIADNIANSSTDGYKRADVSFNSLVIGEAAGKGTYTAGGVRVTSTKVIDQRGPLVTTDNPLDLAITGKGMLPVTELSGLGQPGAQYPLTLTTTGSFRLDEDGILRTGSGLVLMGWAANADGTFPEPVRDSTSGLQPIIVNQAQASADPTTRIELGLNLPATGTDFDADGDPIPLTIEYYGNLGTAEKLAVEFTPSLGHTSGKSNEWSMVIRDSATADDPSTPGDESIIGEYVIVFDDSMGSGGSIVSITAVTGGAYDSTAGTIPLAVGGGTITMNVGVPGKANGLTQIGDRVQQAIGRNGSPAGVLVGLTVDENGLVKAAYDTGFTRTLYKVPLVSVPNVNGLTARDDQTFQVSASSGALFLWDAGTGPTGAILGGALEGSATDVAAELTRLIQTQRAYSSNAKVIQTVDEMLQETTNLKR